MQWLRSATARGVRQELFRPIGVYGALLHVVRMLYAQLRQQQCALTCAQLSMNFCMFFDTDGSSAKAASRISLGIRAAASWKILADTP